VSIFPYIFLAYMVLGATWLYVANRRKPGILGDLALDLVAHPTGLGPTSAAELEADEVPSRGVAVDLVRLEATNGAGPDGSLAAGPA